MLPLSVQVPASIVMLAGGAVACFAGYRLFKLVLGIYGFILGALVASSIVGTAATWTTVLAAVAGGAVGAFVLVIGYFAGVALVGAGLGALVVHLASKAFGREPHWIAVLVGAALGAMIAINFQRYVIILATSFGGAWTMLVGAAAMMLGKGARAASASTNMWVVYPGYAGPPSAWIWVAWVVISLTGVYVQLHAAGRTKARSRKR
jgi:hypothetical protein